MKPAHDSRDLNLLHLMVFIAIVLCLAIRQSAYRDLYTPWGEDIELILGSMDSRISLWTPVYDAPVALERLCAKVIVSAFGLYWAPYAFSWLSFILVAYVGSYVIRPGFSYIIESPLARAMLAVCLGLGSGTPETAGNLINTTTVMPVLLALASMEKIQGSGVRLVIITLLGCFSTHTGIIVAPLLLAQAYFAKRKLPYLLSLGLLILNVAIVWSIFRNAASFPHHTAYSIYDHMVAARKSIIETLQIGLVLIFTGGKIKFDNANIFSNQSFFACILSLFAWCSLWRSAPKHNRLIATAAWFCLLMYLFAQHVARLPSPSTTMLYNQVIPDGRHSMIFNGLTLCAWTPLLSGTGGLPTWVLRGIIISQHLVIVFLLSSLQRLPTPVPNWRQSVEALQHLSSSSEPSATATAFPHPPRWAKILCSKNVTEVTCSGRWNYINHSFQFGTDVLAAASR